LKKLLVQLAEQAAGLGLLHRTFLPIVVSSLTPANRTDYFAPLADVARWGSSSPPHPWSSSARRPSLLHA
jgi:hypothetical protein